MWICRVLMAYVFVFWFELGIEGIEDVVAGLELVNRVGID